MANDTPDLRTPNGIDKCGRTADTSLAMSTPSGSNLDRYKADLKRLVERGEALRNAMQFECFPKEFGKQLNDLKVPKERIAEFTRSLPSFKEAYRAWYSEAQELIKQLLPNRLEDFVALYEKPKGRKELSYGNYVVDDYLHGMTVTRGYAKEKVVGPDAAITRFAQQLAIVKSAETRFESSLFDIRQLVQADLLDSELDAAAELARNKFLRAAGAVAGVVLEKHLRQVCSNHRFDVKKKDPSINDLGNLLRDGNVLDMALWRFVQHLADLRNLCDHDKQKEPTKENVDDLIAGVMKITKTLF